MIKTTFLLNFLRNKLKKKNINTITYPSTIFVIISILEFHINEKVYSVYHLFSITQLAINY